MKELQFEDHFFDYVALLSTIEHVPKNDRRIVIDNVSRVLKNKGLIIMAFPYRRQSNFCFGAVNIVKSNYKHPWQIIAVTGRFLMQGIMKFKKVEQTKITEEHPFPLPTNEEIAGYLPDNLHIIAQLKTEAHHFLIIQNG